MSPFAWCVNMCKIMVSPIEAINQTCVWGCVGVGGWVCGCVGGCVCVCVCGVCMCWGCVYV